MAALAAGTVFMFAGGVVLIVAGVRGTPETRRETSVNVRVAKRLAVSVLLGIFVIVLTGWVGLAFAVSGMVYMIWGMYLDRTARTFDRDRLFAMTGWFEMLRDSVAAGAGVARAILVTSDRAPTAIRPEVRLLAARLDTERLDTALWQFGEEVDMPAADTAVAALVIATRNQGSNITGLLRGVIDVTRRSVDQQARIEALRAKFVISAMMMAIITSITAGLVIGGSAQFRRTYDSVVGQVVIALVGGIFILAIWILRRMATPRARQRITGES